MISVVQTRTFYGSNSLSNYIIEESSEYDSLEKHNTLINRSTCNLK